MLVKYHYVQDSRGGRNSQEELKLVVVEFFFENAGKNLYGSLLF